MSPNPASITGFMLLFFLWGIFRFGIFMAERAGSAMVPPDIYSICAWMLRIVLLFTAMAVFLSVAALYWTGENRTLLRSDPDGMTWAFLSIGVYALAALVMNAPYFPLRWNMLAYGWVHLVLLPCLVPITRNFGDSTGEILIPLALYSVFWRFCLSDRQKIPLRV